MNDDIVKKTEQPESDKPTPEHKTAPERERGSTEHSSANVAQEYLDGWKRAQADFINYKKDEAKRLEDFVRFAASGLILEVIEVVDDLETAAKSLSDSGGVNQIVKKFIELFKKYEVERIPVEGQQFDPALHEAISTEPGGEKMEEVRAGYKMHGRVVRPARVKIVKG